MSNQGPSIEASTLRRVFDPLQRGSPPAVMGGDSSLGLGLYICREIAKAHGGSIEATSDAAATTFTVRLPRDRRATASAQAPTVRRRKTATVDDPLFLVPVSGPESLPDSESGRLFRQTDWAATPLGAVAGWPPSLRVAVSICMNSRFPMFVWWGPQLVNLYNDAYIPMLGRLHPHAFARPARASWEDLWEVLAPEVAAVLEEGRASWNERVRLMVKRNGWPEEAFFTWSYSPIYTEDGSVGGLFCAVTEDTAAVAAEKQRDALLRLAREAGAPPD